MTTKHRITKSVKGVLYYVEERTKTKWKILHIFYSESECKKYIKGLS